MRYFNLNILNSTNCMRDIHLFKTHMPCGVQSKQDLEILKVLLSQQMPEFQVLSPIHVHNRKSAVKKFSVLFMPWRLFRNYGLPYCKHINRHVKNTFNMRRFRRIFQPEFPLLYSTVYDLQLARFTTHNSISLCPRQKTLPLPYPLHVSLYVIDVRHVHV